MKNAKQFPKVFYGMHMEPGVAEYKDESGESYRIFVGEEALKAMDPTYAGKPVYVRHVEKVNLANLQQEADGYVSESFFNKTDGKHWAKFIVVSDAGMDAIQKGWALSNSYQPKSLGAGGEWHAISYSKEIIFGEYEHLAIVPDPRYEKSIILTPEKFKDYNEKKELELSRLANSKGEGPMFEMFKRTKLENSAAKDLEGMSILLPKSKKEITISKLVNDADEKAMNDDEGSDKMANDEHHVMVGEEKMKVNELVGKHLELKQAHEELMKEHEELKQKHDAAEPSEDEAAKKKALELAEHEDKELAEAGKKKNSKYFTDLKNAHKTAEVEAPVVDLSKDKVARGKSQYGSGK